MNKIENILEEAYKSDKKITFDIVDKYNLNESEYINLLDIAKKTDIKIVPIGETSEDAIDFDDSELLIGESIESAYLKEVHQIKRLTLEEERNLIVKAQAGDIEARNRFVEANLRLVLKIANRYRDCGLAYLDLVSEGNLGLMRAIETYDINLGYKFSTYAYGWIRQAISRGLNNTGKTIRIPVHFLENMNKLSRTRMKLVNKLGYEPSIEEVSKESGLTLQQIKDIDQIKYNQEILSLEKPINDEEDNQLGDIVPAQFNLEDEIVKMDTAERIRNLVDQCLTERERTIIAKRFGLDDNINHTLGEIGEEFHITRERVRQIEATALRKLRKKLRSIESPEESKKLTKIIGNTNQFSYNR